MQTGQKLPDGANLAVYAGWTKITDAEAVICGNPTLDNLDYGDRAVVAEAYQKIIEMDVWNDMDWAFRQDGKDSAVHAIAKIILCQKAAIWAMSRNSEVPEGLTQDSLHAAQVEFFSLLSPRGVDVMTRQYTVVSDGIHYTPETGNEQADALLSMVVREEVSDALQGAVAACHAAAILDMQVAEWRVTTAFRAERWRFEAQGVREQKQINHTAAAISLETAAVAWEAADPSGIAVALAWDRAANAWACAGERERRAEAQLHAARALVAADKLHEAGQGYLQAARTLNQLGRDAQAKDCLVQAAVNWEAARQFGAAAGMWEQAGFTGRAARAWSQGPQSNGAMQYFRTTLESEDMSSS